MPLRIWPGRTTTPPCARSSPGGSTDTRKKKAPGEGFGRLPDLILLDGGKTHVAAVEPILRERGLTVPVFGMVKDDRHRTRAITTDGGEIAISSHRSAFTMVTKIQDEVHRFAISYQHKVHKKSSFQLALTKVPGIGEKKAVKLITTFKTKDALKSATPEQLRKAAGVNQQTAKELYELIQTL